MAIPVYSQTLWELLPGYDTSFIQFSPSVPVGFVWVVREITATQQPGSRYGHGLARLLLFANGIPIWSTPFNSSVVGKVYAASDVRFVLATGEAMSTSPADPDWYLRVSGYQLTAT